MLVSRERTSDMNEQEAIEIMNKIKKECNSADGDCNGCIFHEMYGECPLVGNPQNWDIETEEE